MPYAGRRRDNRGRFVSPHDPPDVSIVEYMGRMASQLATSYLPPTLSTADTTTTRSYRPTWRVTAPPQPARPTAPARPARPTMPASVPTMEWECEDSDCSFSSNVRDDFHIDNGGRYICESCVESDTYFYCNGCEELYHDGYHSEDGYCERCCAEAEEDSPRFHCGGCDVSYEFSAVDILITPADYNGHRQLCRVCYDRFVSPEAQAQSEIRQNNRMHPRLSTPMADRLLPRTFPENPKDVRSRILIRCPFGIEIETTNGGDKSLEVQSITGFSGIGDGSIQSDKSADTGLEFVSPVFLDDSGLKQIERLCGLGLETNKTCGLHMHLDARDWDWQMLRKFMTLAKMVEQEVIEIMPPHRRNDTYCQLLRYDADEILDCEDKHQFLGVMMNLSESQFNTYLKQKGGKLYSASRSCVRIGGTNIDKRYEWVNVMSYYYRGSVEIRIHEGTTDYKTIYNWILLWQAVVQWLKSHTLADIETMSTLWDIPNEKIVSFYDERRKRLCADYLAQSASMTQVS